MFSSVTSEQPELSSLRNLLPENLEEYISPSEVNTDVMIINRRLVILCELIIFMLCVPDALLCF